MFLLLIFVLMFSIQIYLSDAVAVGGEDLNYYEEQLTQSRKANEHLSNEYYTLTSLHSISERAQKNGFAYRNLDYYSPYNLASR